VNSQRTQTTTTFEAMLASIENPGKNLDRDSWT
jgi:hypothetical protein